MYFSTECLWIIFLIENFGAMSGFEHFFGFVSMNIFVGQQPRKGAIWGRKGKTFCFFFSLGYFCLQSEHRLPSNFKIRRWLCQHQFIPKVSSFPKQWSCQLTSLVTATFRHFNKSLLFTLSAIISFLCIACSRWIYL